MRYLILVYGEEEAMAAVPPPTMAELINESLDYDQALVDAGHLIAAQALEPVATARTLRMQGGKHVLTDGPFAETKEQLLGFLLVNAADEAEALRLAKDVPVGRYATLEIRPVREMQRTWRT